MSADDTQRTLGEHGARLLAVERDVAEIGRDVKAIRDTLAQARGGWKTLLLVAGAAGAMGALLGKIVAIVGLLKP